MLNLTFRVLATALLALAVVPQVDAQTQVAAPNDKARPSEPPNLIDPFAARANRFSQQPQVDPDVSEFVENATGKIAPRRSSPDAPRVDAVVLKDGTRLEGVLQRLSYSDGARIVVDGQELRVELSQIERVDLSVSETFALAVDAFESGVRAALDSQFRLALALFREARANSDRRIEKEWATAKIVETLLALGLSDDAAVEFFILCRIDPYPAFLSSIPLRWRNQRSAHADPESKRRAEDAAAEWLDKDENPSGVPNPAARLLAASILLQSAERRVDAISAINDLCALEPPEGAAPDVTEACRVLSLLALAQNWRLEVLQSPDRRTVDRWRRTLELMPNACKPGPAYLIGLGESALGDDSEARQYFMIASCSSDRETSRDAFLKCASSCERLGDSAVAAAIRERLEKNVRLNQ
ncbi:MAG: hypothetical protein ACOX0A_06735 [Thermoguttaceae bacterium]|jgi:hypothetical protein